MKKDFLITLLTKENTQKYKVNLELKNNIYRYNEDKEKKTLVEFNTQKNILKRENEDLSMEFLFVEGKSTIGKIYIKDMNKYLDVVIETEKIIKKDLNIKIIYYLEKDLYEYSIEIVQ